MGKFRRNRVRGGKFMSLRARLFWLLGRLRVQFTLYVAAILVAFTALVLAINWYSQEQIVLDRLDAHVEYVADLTAMLVKYDVGKEDPSALSTLLSKIVELEKAMAVAVISPEGDVLAAARGSETSGSLGISSNKVVNASPWPVSDTWLESAYLFAATPIVAGDYPSATVHIARSLSRPGTQPGASILENAEFGTEASSLQQILTVNALIGLAIFALAIPLAGFLMNRATRGISDVTDAALRAAQGDLDVTLPVSGSGEVVELQNSFRTMQEELKKNIREIETLAYTDSVTGLANRARFQARLNALLALGEFTNGAVLLVDLDNFKVVNDTHGHKFGDIVLRHVSQHLERIVRETCVEELNADYMVARFVGDGFVVFVGVREKEPVWQDFANKLIDGLEETCEIDGKRIHVACSIGIAAFDGTDVSVEQLLQQADLAMYAAKQHGRRQAQSFSNEIMVAADRRAKLESSLRRAIQNNELSVSYQPKVSCLTREIIGAEALVRWRDPTYGDVEPTEFIPIAEDSGLIVDIDSFVLRQSLSDFSRLHASGIPLTIAVNVSAQKLQRVDFVSTISEALAYYDFRPEYLEIELTESEAIVTSELREDPMQELRKCGVRFAIDDFGTGFSSLSRLPSFQFDTLKIDKSFVARLADDRSNQAIIHLVLSLARSLNLEVVAEGVEREEDFLILQKEGSHIAQGFLWGPALPFAEFEKQVRSSTATSLPRENDVAVLERRTSRALA